MSEGARVEDTVRCSKEEMGSAEPTTPSANAQVAAETQGETKEETFTTVDDDSVLAQVQKYQLRHKLTAAEDGESDLDSASDSDCDEEEDYQVFGRMTIKAQSEAFYQVRMQQKENSTNTAGRTSTNTIRAKSSKVPRFMMRKQTSTLQPLKESN